MNRLAVVLPLLALAACGNREGSADSPAARRGAAVQVSGGAPVAVSGGDTSAAGQPGVGVGSATAAAPGAAAAPASPGAAGQQQDANAILRRVEETAAGVRTLEADFTQNLHVPLLGQDQRSTGKLYQRKPDRFLMRFTEPAGDIMVADGQHFWIYYPSNDRTQVVRTSIAQGGQQADFQKQFLANATDRFVATLNRDEVVGGRPAWSLTLVPKGESPYKTIRIWVDKQDYMVRRFEMTEENDSVRRLELANLKVNQPVSDALFTFTPPPGTQVFDQ